MKCPKCGFVSYAGLEQCKKCGYPFVKVAPKGSSSSLTTLFPEGVRSVRPTLPEPSPERKENPHPAVPELLIQQAPPAETAPVAMPSIKENVSESDRSRVDELPQQPPPERKENPHPAVPELLIQQAPPAEAAPLAMSSIKDNVSEPDRSRVDEPPQGWIKELSERVETFRSESDRSRLGEQPEDWREELSERVETFRKRRARLQPDAAPAGNLELDFEGLDIPEINGSVDDVLGNPDNSDSSFDLEIGAPPVAQGTVNPPPETHSLKESADEMMQLDAAPAELEEMSLGEPTAQSPPMEILVDSPTQTGPEDGEEAEGIFLAPLSRRFLAGLTDALVLILGAAVFGIIFWQCGGRLSMVPLNIVVLGLVVVILIFAYFAVFTAIASATPGLLWMGCEIRNMGGGRPTVRESFWRAFGVLVSLSALMLGFIWACVDSDNLTWHDRMSQTVITDEVNATDLAGQKAET